MSRREIKGVRQFLDVGVKVIRPDKIIKVATDRHIGNRVEVIKLNVITTLELALPIGLKRFLVARKESSNRVRHQVEKQSSTLFTIAQLIETLERENRILEHTLTTLIICQLSSIGSQ